MRRHGMVIGIRPERIDEYKALHAAVWPEIVDLLSQAHVRDYTIYLREPENLLFSHFVYEGQDFAQDMAAMAEHPVVQRWWALCGPCQRPLSSRSDGEHWAGMTEVFHMD